MDMRNTIRQERKFLMSYEEKAEHQAEFGKIFPQDQNNGDDGYMIRSLYFDTFYDRDFNEKLDGVEIRRKMRLRMYDPESDTAFFEMKQKQGSNQRKRSLKVSAEDARIIASGNYSPLLRYEGDFAAECYGVLMMNAYRPKVIVEYRRKAFVLPENNTRITFDSDIRASELCGDFFQKTIAAYPVLHPAQSVLEVKFNHFLMGYVKDIINNCDKSELSVSKYVLARQRKNCFQ